MPPVLAVHSCPMIGKMVHSSHQMPQYSVMRTLLEKHLRMRVPVILNWPFPVLSHRQDFHLSATGLYPPVLLRHPDPAILDRICLHPHKCHHHSQSPAIDLRSRDSQVVPDSTASAKQIHPPPVEPRRTSRLHSSHSTPLFSGRKEYQEPVLLRYPVQPSKTLWKDRNDWSKQQSRRLWYLQQQPQ